MKKIIFILFAILSFRLFAEETEENAALAVSETELSESPQPQLILHHNGFFDLYTFNLLDGTKLSNGELNKLLKTVPENKPLLTKANIFTGIDYVLFAGLCASVAINAYASNKEWDDMFYYSAVAGMGCYVFAVCSSMLAHSYKSCAVDNYNLRVMGIPLKVR